jgi:hypothetical protein
MELPGVTGEMTPMGVKAESKTIMSTESFEGIRSVEKPD